MLVSVTPLQLRSCLGSPPSLPLRCLPNAPTRALSPLPSLLAPTTAALSLARLAQLQQLVPHSAGSLNSSGPMTRNKQVF